MMLASELALAYEDWRLFDSTRFCFHFVVGILFHIPVFGHPGRRLGGFGILFELLSAVSETKHLLWLFANVTVFALS